ncbi:uncharacterized protein LOC123009922 [Tribolium madens]|uniref:uncharacterized protein LOC123009922 n=1 Tax=Tribolium madens TaxID=41895 RepID=UPI001CF7209D|nr:uncharacterized protein LOC123009922 [Tribolium madens]
MFLLILLLSGVSPHSNSPLSKCLQSISLRFSAKSETFWVSHNQSDLFDSNFLKILTSQGHPISISSDFNPDLGHNFWTQTDNYLIESSNDLELESTLQNLKYLHSWNPKSKFIIGVNNSTETNLSKMIEILWYEGIYNFILAISSFDNSKITNLYSWYPYKCQNGLNFDQFRLFDTCQNGVLVNGANLFPVKIPQTLRFCKLVVGAVVWPPYVMTPTTRVANTDRYIVTQGLEVRLIETICQKLKMNVSYTISEKPLNWGHLSENGTGTGLMALLRQKKIDVAIASLTPTYERLKFFENSQSYYFESFRWCVPHAHTQPSWRKVLDAVSTNLWATFLGSFIAFSCLVWSLSQRRPETHYRRLTNCFQALYGIALSISVRPHPKSHYLRWITCFWLIFCFNFGILYNTRLVSVLTKPTYETQTKTIEQVIQNRLGLLLPSSFFSHFDKNLSLSDEILNMSSECHDMRDCLNRVAYDRDSAICLSSTYIYYVKKSYISDNKPLIFCFSNNIATYPVVLLMKKGFPLKSRLNEIISRLVEGGFVDFWARQVYTHKWKSEMSKLNSTSDSYVNMERLKSAFVCLLTGLVTSFVVLICELVHFVFNFLKNKQIFIV